MNNTTLRILAVAVSVFVTIDLVLSKQAAAAQDVSCTYKIPEAFQGIYVELTQKIERPEIPESHLYRTGITVDETILGSPEMATRKTHAIGESTCKDKGWIGGQSNFDTQFLIKNPEPLPTELPAERKKSLIEKCREWGKTEAETEKYLANMLESHRKSKENLVKGQVDIQIVNAPSAQSAFDYLISQAILSNMPLTAIVGQFGEAAKVSGLGTVGYGKNTIRFIRDNIAVIVRANGEFSNEAMDIAKKIDAALLKQPLLTYEQLQARCPKLHIQPGKKAAETDVPFLEYSVQAPPGVGAWMRDLKINDKVKSLRDNKIPLEEKPKKVKIQATVVSSELLVSTIETQIDMPVD